MQYFFFFRNSCPLWDNVEKYCRAQQATYDSIIRRMCIACWINKATDTHLEEVNLLIFHNNNGCTNVPQFYVVQIWCGFDRASSLICGNKMPTRCNTGFYCRSYYLLNMFRVSLCSSSGAQEYYTVVAACGISCCGFSSSWSGVELRVMRPVCRMLVYWLCFVASR